MPYFDGILVTVDPDPSVRLANLRAGKIDVLSLDKSQYAIVKEDPALNVYRFPGNHPARCASTIPRACFKTFACGRR